MGEAAVKEPSMEDILSSIRKIISEEGSAPFVEQKAPSVESPAPQEPVAQEIPTAKEPQMSDVLAQVRAETPEVETTMASAVETPVSEEITGNQAAKMAASLASIAETVRAEPETETMVQQPSTEQSVWEDVAHSDVDEPVLTEPTYEEPVAAMHEPVETQQAPSLASIAENIVEQVEVPASSAPQTFVEPEIHVEMAEATPAPTSEVVESDVSPVSTAAVETMVEEEMAFKGALMSPSANGEVAGAFDRLKRSAMDDIDAKTEAILRPMLREWLDENLPNMVERLVREEIERVARGV